MPCESSEEQTTLINHLLPVNVDSWHRLPNWAILRDVAKITGGIEFVAGPALHWSFRSFALLAAFFLTFALLATWATSCADKSDAAAEYPAWLLLVYAPVLVISLFWEWRVLQHVLPQLAHEIGSFKFMGVRVSFNVWFVLAFAVSATMHTDLITNTLFMAKVVKTDTCLIGLTDLWAHTLQQSLWGNVPGLREVNFTSLVFAGWCLILVQFLLGIAGSFPVSRKCWHPNTPKSKRPEVDRPQYKFYDSEPYFTLIGRVYHDNVLYLLADVTRMATLTLPEAQYMEVMADRWVLSALARELYRLIRRFLIFRFFEGAIQINLQVTWFMLTRGGGWDWQTVVSMCLTFLTSLLTLKSDTDKMLALTNPFFDASRTKDSTEYTAMLSAAKRAWHLYLAIACTYCVVLMYAMLTFAMSFTCESSIWQITGCVAISGT